MASEKKLTKSVWSKATTAKKKPATKVPSKAKTAKVTLLKLNSEGKKLVIVESPGKVKTISKYLGSDYIIKASVGHIVDLIDKNMWKLVEKWFEPDYEVDPKKKKVF